jgi:ankyrin repeat protein
MENNKKIESVLVLGQDVSFKTNDLYEKVLGNTKTGVTLEQILDSFRGNIDSNTIIKIFAHGAVDFFGNHIVSLNEDLYLRTNTLLNHIQSCASNIPLQIELISCYSGGATDAISYLTPGSTLITTSKKDYPTQDPKKDKHFLWILKESKLENNPYISFFKTMYLDAATHGALHTISGKFQISPSPDILLSADNVTRFLEEEYKRFSEFTENRTWTSKAIELPQTELSEEKKDLFASLLFSIECGNNPLFHLFLKNHLNSNDYLKKILDRFDLDETYTSLNMETPLHLATEQGRTNTIKLLLNSGADPNKANNIDGATPLCIASQEGHTDIVNLLLGAGADPNKASDEGANPILVAAQEGHFGVVKLLLGAGSDPNKAKNDGSTLILLASHHGHINIAKLLLGAGADPNKATDDEVFTPILVAAEKGNVGVVKLLLDAGADPNKESSNAAYTPLHVAAEKGNVGVVKLLLDAGADHNKDMNEGIPPLLLATQEGHTDIVEIIENHISKQESSEEPSTQDQFSAEDQHDTHMTGNDSYPHNDEL